jgi:uncharacterized protein YkwD
LLRKAEDKILHSNGMLLGAATHGTLRLRSITYQTARATTWSKQVTHGVIVAGVVRHSLTFVVVEIVRDPASRVGQQNAKLEQGILASLSFARPAPAGSFKCIGTGTSQPVAATPTVTTTPTLTATPAPSRTAAPAVPTATQAVSTLPGGIPTSGTTANGCAIFFLQAEGEAHVLALLNADRAAAGVAPLTLNNAVSVAARNHSCDMQQHDSVGHSGSDGSLPPQRISAVGVSYATVGENVGTASGYGLTGGLDSMDRQMMGEAPTEGTHHWNIVNAAFHQVGIGVIVVGPSVWLTEDFIG